MGRGWLAVPSVLAVLLSLVPVLAQPSADSAAELKTLVTKVQTKLHDGKRTEAELADELKEFDSLIDKHKGEKTDSTAQILLMKGLLYVQVLGNMDKGVELVRQIKQDYPNTQIAKNADSLLENLQQQAAAYKIQQSLVQGAKFPDFQESDLNGKPLSVSSYAGKVTLISF